MGVVLVRWEGVDIHTYSLGMRYRCRGEFGARDGVKILSMESWRLCYVYA